jgi:hypothetical protein
MTGTDAPANDATRIDTTGTDASANDAVRKNRIGIAGGMSTCAHDAARLLKSVIIALAMAFMTWAMIILQYRAVTATAAEELAAIEIAAAPLLSAGKFLPEEGGGEAFCVF